MIVMAPEDGSVSTVSKTSALPRPDVSRCQPAAIAVAAGLATEAELMTAGAGSFSDGDCADGGAEACEKAAVTDSAGGASTATSESFEPEQPMLRQRIGKAATGGHSAGCCG